MSRNEMLTAVRVCCEDTLIASPRRHEVGFEKACVCGNIIRRHWAGGWEYFAPRNPGTAVSGGGTSGDLEPTRHE